MAIFGASNDTAAVFFKVSKTQKKTLKLNHEKTLFYIDRDHIYGSHERDEIYGNRDEIYGSREDYSRTQGKNMDYIHTVLF